MRRRGFFRPIAAAGKGVEKPVIKAGNLTQETAVSIGLDEQAIFVYTDGTRPIVHVRTDIEPDSAAAAALAIEDNESQRLSYEADVDILAALSVGDGALLSGLRQADPVFDDLVGDALENCGVMGKEKLREEMELLRPIEFFHALLSIEIENATTLLEVKNFLDSLEGREGLRILYGANG
jgi:hypothetical protein